MKRTSLVCGALLLGSLLTFPSYAGGGHQTMAQRIAWCKGNYTYCLQLKHETSASCSEWLKNCNQNN